MDDEQSLRDLLVELLNDEGYSAFSASSAEQALSLCRKATFHVVLTDIRMEGMDGLTLLQHLKKHRPDTEVLIMTSHASIDSAINALRRGAYDYLLKPFEELELVTNAVNRALDKLRLTMENRKLLEVLKTKNEELRQRNIKLHEMAIRDGLTGLYNHRYFQQTFDKKLEDSRRNGAALSLVLLDVDNFKVFNDNNGHLEGDRLLMQLAKLISSHARRSDISSRYGGEEFALLLPDTELEHAVKFAETIREKIAAHPFRHRERQPNGCLTVSIGIASYPARGEDKSELFQAADESLYEAKRQGRNRVCYAKEEQTEACV